MKAILVPGKTKHTIGTMVLDFNKACPFEAENDFEEALLFYLHKIGNAVEDMEGATSGELDNAAAISMYALEKTLSVKLDAVIEELRLMRQGRAI